MLHLLKTLLKVLNILLICSKNHLTMSHQITFLGFYLKQFFVVDVVIQTADLTFML